LLREQSEEDNMVTTSLEEFFSLRGEVEGLHSPLGMLVESRRSPNERRPRGSEAPFADQYESYVPVKRIYVPLEAAATSPFMDA
jgi:hypothetical protein